MNHKLGVTTFYVGALCLILGQALWAQSTNPTSRTTNLGCGASIDHPALPTRPPTNDRRTDTQFGSARLILVSDHSESEEGNASIVGFWKVQLMLLDGTVIDNAYVQWHSDGTELMNSGSRPPSTGNFCMGVWKKTSRGVYKLNHFALGWDPTGTILIGPTNIHELITVSRDRKTYQGTFGLDQLDNDGNVLFHLDGTITGQRITAE
jgi:hypothetical protein